MPESEFIGLRLDVGKYVVRSGGKHTETVINVKANETIYIRVSRIGDGFSGMRDSIHIENEAQARFQMEKAKPLQDKNIKDNTRRWIKTITRDTGEHN